MSCCAEREEGIVEELISIIVPVYKVEEYLPACLDSLVHQTYKKLEIILVDDASPDGCGEICDSYAARDDRIRCIHKEKNAGQAAARNTGMDVAGGEYLFFADSDDWLAEDALEKLYEGLKRHRADCCVGGCVTVMDGGGGEGKAPVGGKTPDARRGERVETSRDAMRHVLLDASAAWNRLCRREMLEGLRFPLDRVNDDECFILRAYERMEKIVFLDCGTYFYRKRANSITTSAFSVKMVDCFYNSRDNLEFVKKAAPELIPAAEYKYCRSLLWCYVNLRRLKRDERAETLRRQLRREIRRSRRTALSNPYLSFPLKALALLCQIM